MEEREKEREYGMVWADDKKEYQQSGVLATHIKTYTIPPPTPQKRTRVLRKLEASEGKLNALEEEHAIVEDKVWGKTKATFAAKD